MKLLKRNDFWVIGFDSNAKKNFEKFKWFKKNLLIFGSENYGIGKNLLTNCDEVLKINISNKIDSLNGNISNLYDIPEVSKMQSNHKSYKCTRDNNIYTRTTTQK